MRRTSKSYQPEDNKEEGRKQDAEEEEVEEEEGEWQEEVAETQGVLMRTRNLTVMTQRPGRDSTAASLIDRNEG